jgi:excisionase family DNA binding protein
MKDLISIKEFAKRIGKSRQWVWFLIMSKRITAVKIGNQYIIDAEEINKINNKKFKEENNENEKGITQ